VPTKTPPLVTAYVHSGGGQGELRMFITAPRAFVNPAAAANSPAVLGLLLLDPARFGLAQVDVDGGLLKNVILAETINPSDAGRNLDPNAQPEPAPHPEVFDPGATLPALRSGGLSLFADRRGLQLLATLQQGKAMNDKLLANQLPPPLAAEDLVRGYRLDVWNSRTAAWHSLHLRKGQYQIGAETFTTEAEEGFVQMAATQPAPGAPGAEKDFYVHEAIARWAGWSLSVPRPGKHLSRHADPNKAVPPDGDDPEYREDQPETPFNMQVAYRVLPGSLPSLRFGARYRLRARAVDLAGNSLAHDAELSHRLALAAGLPRDAEGFAYLRYEPVIAPLVALRDARGVTDPGSAVDRLVIRTFNDDISKDGDAADTTAADRHILPPRTSVEMGERLSMFDDETGKLGSDAATWQLIAERDAGAIAHAEIEVAGKTQSYPLEPTESLDALPYLPDPLSRGAALRDLPGTSTATIGRATPDAGAAEHIPYSALSDPNPRPGSVTMISFGDSGDWRETRGFRLALAEPAPEQIIFAPHWDPAQRVLTIFLPKGQTRVVPLTSYLTADDLKLMGVWQWLREYIERITVTNPQPQYLRPGAAVDEIAHILQRTVEGGHWMLTPPRLLTLVHAVQQPLGRPSFTGLSLGRDEQFAGPSPLQTVIIAGRIDPTELAPLTAWRRTGATDAYLLGALRVHGASTAKVDLRATWDDPVDDLAQDLPGVVSRNEHVEELPLPTLREDYLHAPGKERREVGYYDPEHDQMVFVRAGDSTARPRRDNLRGDDRIIFQDAAPRHLFNDTKYHRVSYTAVATSRYREYFPQPAADEAPALDFTRASESIVVEVPASARPLAATVAYVLPTFGWQRQTETNLKRSVRFGNGLRVYLHRPWFSSGAGELLGVALWSSTQGALNTANRDKFKSFITQWGMDPIWQSGQLAGAPGVFNFPGAAAQDYAVTLEERTAYTGNDPGRVDVVGFPVEFDASRGLWYADVTLNTFTQTYMPFVRLALVRYQPRALADAKVSRVVLADFAQLTPDRAAMVTSDPHHPRTVRVVVSGVAPRGPQAVAPLSELRRSPLTSLPTRIRVRVQERDPELPGELAWRDVAADVAQIKAEIDQRVAAQPDLALWAGAVTFKQAPPAGQYRLLIEEHEYISAAHVLTEGGAARQPRRLIYAETLVLDDALLSAT
jgi:hypothetical protein